jgi:hypothetical protein
MINLTELDVRKHHHQGAIAHVDRFGWMKHEAPATGYGATFLGWLRSQATSLGRIRATPPRGWEMSERGGALLPRTSFRRP